VAVERLAALADQDPTNPWYGIWQGEYLRHLGHEQEAEDLPIRGHGPRPALPRGPADDRPVSRRGGPGPRLITVDRELLTEYVGLLPHRTMQMVMAGVRIVLDL
jgi:hypothetical protein